MEQLIKDWKQHLENNKLLLLMLNDDLVGYFCEAEFEKFRIEERKSGFYMTISCVNEDKSQRWSFNFNSNINHWSLYGVKKIRELAFHRCSYSQQLLFTFLESYKLNQLGNTLMNTIK